MASGGHATCEAERQAAGVGVPALQAAPDLPSGTHAGAARYIAVDGDIVCDFSDYSRLHSIVYQEIIAGRGHRIEDAAGAVKLAERVRQMAELERPGAD
jgi:hypothetical protein